MSQPYSINDLIASLEDKIPTGRYIGYSLGEVLMFCDCFEFLESLRPPLLLANEAVEEMRHMFPESFPNSINDDSEYVRDFTILLDGIRLNVEGAINDCWRSYKDEKEAQKDPLVMYGIDKGYIDLSDDEELYGEVDYDYDEMYSHGQYRNYRGSYAQDEMGYSDDDIDTIFDGDTSAYWNID